jgi:hypothetical protein
MVARQLEQCLADDLGTEVSCTSGLVVKRGTPGAIRVDVAVGPVDAPLAIYDLKTGSAKLTDARVAQIRRELPASDMFVPILEVRP